MEFFDRDRYRGLSGIYLIRNKVNGLVYVGQTRQKFIKRYFLHRYKLRHGIHDNCHLQRAFAKYGEESFEFIIVEVLCGDKELFNEREMFYINKYRQGPGCYNLTAGGDGAKGTRPSEENIRRLAEINRRLNTGRKLSETTRLRMSEAQRKRHQQYPMSDALKRKVIDGRREGLESGNYRTQKIVPKTVEEIQRMLMQGAKQADVAAKFGISQTNVSAIKNGRSWKFVSIEGWNEWRKQYHRSTLCQADSSEGATTIPQRE